MTWEDNFNKYRVPKSNEKRERVIHVKKGVSFTVAEGDDKTEYVTKSSGFVKVTEQYQHGDWVIITYHLKTFRPDEPRPSVWLRLRKWLGFTNLPEAKVIQK